MNFFFTLTFAISALLQTENKHKLTIRINGFENDKGQAYVAVYNSETDFLKKLYKGKVVKIENKSATLVFTDLPEGIYAVSTFHDENNNGKMDTNFMGIPKEDYGTSNDAKGFMGPPKYKDAKFSLTADKTISIKIH